MFSLLFSILDPPRGGANPNKLFELSTHPPIFLSPLKHRQMEKSVLTDTQLFDIHTRGNIFLRNYMTSLRTELPFPSIPGSGQKKSVKAKRPLDKTPCKVKRLCQRRDEITENEKSGIYSTSTTTVISGKWTCRRTKIQTHARTSGNLAFSVHDHDGPMATAIHK